MNPLGSPITVNVIARDPLLVSIPQLDFTGRIVYSAGLTYAVVFADSYRTADGWLHGGGFRDSGHGTVALLEGASLLWQRAVPRPVAAAVSDRGDVLVCDLGFGMGLKTTIILFDRHEKTCLEEKISAIAHSCAITPDGDVALLNSCGSDVAAHSYKLFAYSIPEARRVFATDFPISQIETAVRTGQELAVTAEGLVYRFSPTGQHLNVLEIEERLFDKETESGQYTIAYYRLERYAKAGRLSDAERAFLQDRFRRLSVSSAPIAYRPKCFKHLGELALLAGDRKGAARHFRAALELNPKIGLRKRLAILEKEIAGMGCKQ